MNTSYARVLWHWVRWPLAVLAVLYVALAIYRVPAVMQKEKAKEVVRQIESAHISLPDVMGEHLPTLPDPQVNDSTVAGIDANQNGIRDDVELAIFAKYPNSAKVRAAELQYAMALQMELTKVFDTSTWIAAANKDSWGYQCIAGLSSRENLSLHLKNTRLHVKEVEDWVINTELRKKAYDSANLFTTSFGSPNTDFCDISLSLLSN